MSSKFTRTKKNGGVEALLKRIKTPGTVDVGIIDAGDHASSDLTVAAIGYINEFGAEFLHPGGTPYVITEGGQAQFVTKGTKNVAGVTQPHNIVIPERSFLRSTLQEQRKKLKSIQIKLSKKIIAGTTDTKKALGLIGEYLSDKVTQKIVSLTSPPNKAATIRRKNSSNPLIDTGQLKNAITYEVNI